MSSGADPMLGTIVGSFRITKALGRGGMGSVYLAEHTIIASKVAIKVLHDRLAADENLVARFYAEARAVNLIGHENIVNIFDMNVVPPNRYYLVMEYLEGQPLNYLLTRPVPAEVAIPILMQVCDALQAAHKAGIVHRDLKPENIFLTRRGKQENFVKVLDFGLAKLLDQAMSPQQTAAGLIVGTPEFMSPEQANSTPVDGRADIYGLGCIAWLLATARLPFPQKGFGDLLIAHRQQMPQPPHVVNPSVSKAWSDVIMKAMQKLPEQRYQEASQLSAAFEAALKPATSAPAAARPPAVAPLVAPPPPGAPGAPPPASGGAPVVRHEAGFDAVATMVDGRTLGSLACRDISKGGMFLCGSEVPPLFSRLKISIPSHKLELFAEVVRHVPPDQAAAWGMAPGFGVQFLDMTPALRTSVAGLLQGLPVQAPPKGSATKTDDPKAEAVLAKYRSRVNGDHYQMLAAANDADFPDLKARARDEQKELEGLKPLALSDGQKAQLDAALARVKTAIEVLGSASTRADYDANRGNYKGIARCLAAGLQVAELERLRAVFLEAHPGASGSAYVKFLASKSHESRNDLRPAIETCEAALQLDPLNLQFQQRYAHLSKRAREAPK